MSAAHKGSLNLIPDRSLREAGLYVCRTCNKKVYQMAGALSNHLALVHSGKRSKTNQALLHDKLSSSSSRTESSWQPTLQWLLTLKVQPPPIRSVIFDKLDRSARDSFLNTYGALLHAVNDSLQPFHGKASVADYDRTPVPLLKLLVLFPALILAPLEKGHADTISGRVRIRLASFHRGSVQPLHASLYAIVSRSPAETAASAKQALATPFRVAQIAADSGNLSTALKHCISTCPRVLLDDAALEESKALYPDPYPECAADSDTPRWTRSSGAHEDHGFKGDYAEDELIRYLRGVKTGKAAGAFGDITDYIRALGLMKNRGDDRYPHIQQVGRFLKILEADRLPKTVRSLFTSVFYCMLYKDWPANPHKKRPIGVGGNWRRVTCSVNARHTAPYGAEDLLPRNYGIGVDGGAQFLVHTVTLEVERYVTRTPEELPFRPPTRCLLALDLVNMFNRMSRRRCRAILTRRFPHLVGLFDTLYREETTVHFQRPSGKWDTFAQKEGKTQGCPLSPFFAALVLGDVLVEMDKFLKRAARLRLRAGNKYDDGQGGVTNIMAYIDDGTLCIPFPDVYSFLRRFAKIGAPVGAVLNTEKTKILTSTTGVSPIPFLSPAHRSELRAAIQHFTPGEETQGLRILGIPVGGDQFIRQYLQSFLDTLHTDTGNLLQNMPDLQTAAQVYKRCLLQRVPFQMTADVLLNTTPGDVQQSTDWKTDLTTQVDAITRRVLADIAAVETIPTWTDSMSKLPSKIGGLGLFDSQVSGPAAFVVPLVRSIRYALFGVALKHTTVKLPRSITHLYADWETSNASLFTAFRTHAMNLAPHLTRVKECTEQDPLRYLALEHPTARMAQQLVSPIFRDSKNALIATDSFRPDDLPLAAAFHQGGDNDIAPPDPPPSQDEMMEPMLDADDSQCHEADTVTIPSDVAVDAAPAQPSRPEEPPESQVAPDPVPLPPPRVPPDPDIPDVTEVKAAIPSLLEAHTSKALLDLPRTHAEYRIPNELFRTALRRKLRLPLYHRDGPRPTCPCGATVDIYGDHFFQCRKCSKTALHDKIRDALYSVFTNLANLTGMVYSKTDVHHEPKGLIAHLSGRRPADVGLRLHPHHHSQRSTSRHAYAAVDVTITGTPPTAPDSDQPTQSLQNHMRKEILKLRGATRKESTGEYVPGDDVICALLRRNVILVPFTVDPFGSLGPLARRLLLGNQKSPDIPDYREFLRRCHLLPGAARMLTHTTSTDYPTGALHKANQAWRASEGNRWFGTTYYDSTPATWAQSTLGSAIVTNLAKHIRHYERRGHSDGISSGKPPKYLPGASTRWCLSAPTGRLTARGVSDAGTAFHLGDFFPAGPADHALLPMEGPATIVPIEPGIPS